MNLKKLVAVLLTVLTLICSFSFVGCNKENTTSFNEYVKEEDRKNITYWAFSIQSVAYSFSKEQEEEFIELFRDIVFVKKSKTTDFFFFFLACEATVTYLPKESNFFDRKCVLIIFNDKIPLYVSEEGYVFDLCESTMGVKNEDAISGDDWYVSKNKINIEKFKEIFYD